MKTKKLNKKLVLVLCFLFIATAAMFAETDNVTPVIDNILGFFNSNWVKGLACIALIVEAIALLFAGGQNPQVFKKFLPVIAGTIIFMCAGKIVNAVFGTTNPSFAEDVKGQQ